MKTRTLRSGRTVAVRDNRGLYKRCSCARRKWSSCSHSYVASFKWQGRLHRVTLEDGALRKAICRAPARRFTTYWAVRGEPGDKAQQLIRHRGAQVIPIEDADVFFQAVQQDVESIDEFSRPHPLSTEAAVASLKRYMSESRYRIPLSDLIDTAVERVVEAISGEAFAVADGPPLTSESVTARVRGYEAACATLLAMAPIGGCWAEEEHYRLWQRALERLGSQTSSGGTVQWLELQRYPATLLLYALGLGAVEADRLQFLKRMTSLKY